MLAKAFEELPILERVEPEATWARLAEADELDETDETAAGTPKRPREGSSTSATSEGAAAADGGGVGGLVGFGGFGEAPRGAPLVGRPSVEERSFGMPSAERMLHSLDAAIMGSRSRAEGAEGDGEGGGGGSSGGGGGSGRGGGSGGSGDGLDGGGASLPAASDEAICQFARMAIELRLVWASAVSQIQSRRAMSYSGSATWRLGIGPSGPATTTQAAGLAAQGGGGSSGLPGLAYAAPTSSEGRLPRPNSPFAPPLASPFGGGDAVVPNDVLHRAVIALATHAAARTAALAAARTASADAAADGEGGHAGGGSGSGAAGSGSGAAGSGSGAAGSTARHGARGAAVASDVVDGDDHIISRLVREGGPLPKNLFETLMQVNADERLIAI